MSASLSAGEPQPDIGVFVRRDDYYAGALPTPADTLLLVEVADSSVRYDRQIKLPLYARHRIPELWIVDLEAQLLRIHREPQGDDYLRIEAMTEPRLVGLAGLPPAAADLTGLFG